MRRGPRPDLRVEKLRFTRTLIAEERRSSGQDGKRGGPAGIISPSRKNYIRTQRQRSAFAKADIRSLPRRLAPGPSPLSTAIRVIIMRMSPPLAPSPALGWIRERHALCASLRLSVRKNMNASGGIRGSALSAYAKEPLACRVGCGDAAAPGLETMTCDSHGSAPK